MTQRKRAKSNTMGERVKNQELKVQLTDIFGEKEGKKKFLCKLTKELLVTGTTETRDKLYECDVCNRKCTTARGLARHKRRHTGDKTHKCDVCNKKFIQTSDFIRHKKVHTGEKPYKCVVCNQRFTLMCDLERHKRLHTGEKPYKCDVCNKTFAHISNVITHKRTHTKEKPYECDVCNKRFTQRSNMVRHKIKHTNDKHYECDICNKRFAQRKSLVAHQQMHTGDKPELKNDKIRVHRKDKNFERAIREKSFLLPQHVEHHKIHLKDVSSCNTFYGEIIQSGRQDFISPGYCVCDKCSNPFPGNWTSKQHKAKCHGFTCKCDLCRELQETKPSGIGYICCVCDAEFSLASKLEDHMANH